MSKRFTALATPCFAVSAIVAACTSSSPPLATSTGSDAGGSDANRTSCSPAESVPCVCLSGSFGTAVCSDAGTSLGACVGCPADASAPTDVTTDASTDAKVPPSDAASKDGAADSGAPTPASLVFAHAAPGVPPVRLCLGTGVGAGSLAVTPLAPIPDSPSSAPAVPGMGSFPAVAQGTPGIYPGTIGALPPIVDFSAPNLTLFAVLSSSITGDINYDGGDGVGPDGGFEESCVALIGTHGLGPGESAPGSVSGRLRPGVDFFELPTIPSGTLQASSTYLFSLTGCLAGAVNTGAATCGAGYDGGTSAQVGVARLDTTTVSAGVLGAQFAHRSTAIEGTPFTQAGSSAHSAATGGVIPVFVTSEPDGGTAVVPLQASELAITSSSIGLLPSPAGTYAVDPASAGTLFGVLLVPTDGGSPSEQPYPAGDLVAMPLGTMQVLSDWTATTASTPSAFATGFTYTFLLVGDPAAPTLTIQPADGGPATLNPAYDGRGLHFVAFPNRFTPRPY